MFLSLHSKNRFMQLMKSHDLESVCGHSVFFTMSCLQFCFFITFYFQLYLYLFYYVLCSLLSQPFLVALWTWYSLCFGSCVHCYHSHSWLLFELDILYVLGFTFINMPASQIDFMTSLNQVACHCSYHSFTLLSDYSLPRRIHIIVILVMFITILYTVFWLFSVLTELYFRNIKL